MLSEVMTNVPIMNSGTTSIDEAALHGYLNQARYRVEKALSGYLPEVSKNTSAACPARLASAMRYSSLKWRKTTSCNSLFDGYGRVWWRQ